MPKVVKQKIKKRSNIVVTEAVAHICVTFNNTLVTVTDKQGNVLTWQTAGASGFKGSRKNTPYAAQVTADNAAKKAKEFGVSKLKIEIQGAGSGRESALRAFAHKEYGFEILAIIDVTPIAHNGCRPPKERRG